MAVRKFSEKNLTAEVLHRIEEGWRFLAIGSELKMLLDGASQINLFGLLSTSCSFMTPTRTPSSGSANIHVRVVFANYDGGTHHAFTVRIKSSSTYYTAAASFGVTRPDGTYEFHARFHPGSSLTTYLVQIDLSTTLAGSVFQVAQCTHNAF